jgi:hypothetical protein
LVVRKLEDRARALLTLGATLFAAFAVAGCGDEEPSPAPAGEVSLQELAQYLPTGEPGSVYFADVAAARKELKLPADAEALPYESVVDQSIDPASAEWDLMTAVQPALSPLGLSDEAKASLDPVAEAFDDRAISAAVSGGAEAAMTAIKTTQSFDDLAEALEAEGFDRDGDTLNSSTHPRVTEVTDAGDGVILISNQPEAAADAAADPPGGPKESLELLERADQPIGLAIGGNGQSCVEAYGGWENAAGTKGTFAFETSDAVEADRIETDALSDGGGGDLAEPQIDGSVVEVPFTASSDSRPAVVRAIVSATFGNLYDCG